MTAASHETGLSHDDAVKALERFVVESDDLAELEATIGRFNIFDSLRIVREEIRHSNFLAWLLNPAESHGQGQLFLRAVLMDILRHAEADLRPMSPVDLDGVDLANVDVRREWKNIDLLIVADEPPVIFAIENKIDAGEHSGQLLRYREIVSREFPKHRPMFVFLTREGDEPTDAAWAIYDYRRLFTALERCRRLNAESIGEEVTMFLEHYLSMIRSRLMDDPRIDELCERIYRNHRQALDLIFERRGDSRRSLVAEVTQRLSAQTERWFIDEGGTISVCFLPREWLEVLPPINRRPQKDARAWVRCKVAVGRKSVRGLIQVGPTKEQPPRSNLLEAIKKQGDEFGVVLNRKNVGERWATVFNQRLAAGTEVGPATEESLEAMMKQFDRFAETADRFTNLLRGVFSR